MDHTWKQVNQTLTRTIIEKINALPPPLKTAIGWLPGGGAATSYADAHRWTIIKAAEHYRKEGKLSKEAGQLLTAYHTTLAAEQRTYKQLLETLEKEF